VVVAAVLLVAYVAAAYIAVPLLAKSRYIPAAAQRALALGFAALAVTTFLLATPPKEVPPEMLDRLREAKHGEFAKQFRALRAQQNRRIRIPGVGDVSLRTLGAAAVVVISGGWWLTPWAPVLAKSPTIGDLSVPLGEDLVAAILVLPDECQAVVEPPVLPPELRAQASIVRDDAKPYQLALRALVRGDYAEAQAQLGRSLQAHDAEEFQVQLTLAQAAMYAGRFGEAITAYQAATGLKADQPLVWCQLAAAQIHAGQFALADRPLERAARLCHDQPEATRRVAAACEHLRGLLAVTRAKDFDDAVRQIDESRAECTNAVGEEDFLVAANWNNQAVLHVLRAEYPEAKELFTHAKDIWSDRSGPQEPHVAAVLANQAAMACAQAQYADAEKLLDRAESLAAEMLPAEHPARIAAMNLRAVLQRARGEYWRAQATAESALRISEKNLPADHPCATAVVETLAAVYADRGRYAKAYPCSLRGVSETSHLWGPDHPFLAAAMNRQAEVSLLMKSYSEAESSCREALRLAQRAFGKQHPIVAAVLTTRGRLAYAQGRTAAAKDSLRRACDIWLAVFHEHPDLAEAQAELASVEAEKPDGLAVAAEDYARAMEMLEKFLGEQHPRVARLLAGQAVIDLNLEKIAEAKSCLDRALAIQEAAVRDKVLVEHPPDLAATLDVYATLLRKIKPPDRGRAAEMEARARDILAKHAEEDRPETDEQDSLMPQAR
jgi:tetratricopeptide (TPR) repeat protein